MTTTTPRRGLQSAPPAFTGGPGGPSPPSGDIVLASGQVIRRHPRPRKLPEPETRWVALPPTAPNNHLYALDALRIGDPRGFVSGDWHKEGHWCWIALREHPPEQARTSKADPLLAPLNEMLGTERVLDVREYFLDIEHPEAAQYSAVWASAHERALVEKAWGTLHAVGTISGRTHPLRERCRWVRSGYQRSWCLEALDKAAELLTGKQREAWQGWTEEWRLAKNDEDDYL